MSTHVDAAAAAAEQELLDQVIEAVQSKKCTLFLGAGVHAAPPKEGTYAQTYPEAERPPIGNALAETLAKRSNWHNRYPDTAIWDLQRMSLDYEIVRSRAQLEQTVRESVQDGKRPSPAVKALAKLDFPIVVTTNYDRLFEQGLQETRKQPEIRVYQPKGRVGNFTEEVPKSPEFPWVFKIHGDVGEAGSIVITDEDYIEFIINMSRPDKRPIPEALSYLFLRRPTLFVGYSLLDYNLRLLFRTLRIGWDKAEVPRMYSVDFQPDPLILKVWQDREEYVRFIVQDVWKFVPELYKQMTGEDIPT